MELIVSGGWFGKRGLYECEIEKIEFLKSVEDLKNYQEGFLIVSYDITRETLETDIKKGDFPEIVFIKTGNIYPANRLEGNYKLNLKGTSLSESEYKERIKKIKSFIESGDVYQINLTNRIDFSIEGNIRTLFFDFFRRQPVPYAFFLNTEDFFILSGSMELFLEKRSKRIVSKPIKGTGKTEEELKFSEKDKAENLMITDMVRNDLGRIAKTGSVKVRELFKIEKFATLCQMHSTVEAETEESLINILKATFPPASVTGAPKKRAVEIIDLLEPHARGYYCGCAGFIKGDEFTLSVLIRTAYGRGNNISYFSGCGIVWDSDPEKEYREMLLKIKAFYNKLDV